MKDYYDILDIPLTASPDEIKAKYRQLVRIYHPDRFSNATDKHYAETKLKQLNEAYAALTTAAKGQARATDGPPPVPIIEPAMINFGVVPPHRRRTARVQVGNVGGNAQNVAFLYSEEPRWFTITKGRQIYADRAMPLEFEVAVNTAELEQDRAYSGWVEINMDGITARTLLQLEVGQPVANPMLPRRLIVGALLALLLAALVVVIPLLSSYGQFLQWNGATSASTQPVAERTAEDERLLSSANEAGSASAWSPIYSPDGRQIAFLSDQLGGVQLFLRDPQSGRLRQLTSTPDVKAAVAWSPSGAFLGYISGDGTQSVVQVIDLLSGAATTLAPAQPGLVQRFVWSTDSQSLTFEVATAGETHFYRADVSGASVQLVERPVEW
jgi:hypothetical protein